MTSTSDLDVVDDDGRTALMWACIYGRGSFAMQLIKAQANIKIADKDGNTACDFAFNELSVPVAGYRLLELIDRNGSRSRTRGMVEY